MEARRISVRCCIAGGGPAGMMLGLLLARAGVDVLVLEKHADFLRDFRGDTIHPSTLEVMHELGLLEAFLKLAHTELKTVGVQIGGEFVEAADFTHLPTHCKFIALMPQWDFLDFLAEQGRRLPGFGLIMRAEVTGLIEEDGNVVGLHANTPDGALEISADLVVGADGRHSTVREKAGLDVRDIGAPMDVLWMRLSRRPGDPGQTLGRIDRGRMLVTLDRGDYWQCAYLIQKGGIDTVKQRGLVAFREDLAAIAPHFRDRVAELTDWDDIKLLTVTIDRLQRWHRPGLLCIGDAAHAMSPVGGVGINLAIQDAVAAANILAPLLVRGIPGDDALQAVQQRRHFPTVMTQRMQVMIQRRVIVPVLSGKVTRLPFAMRLLRRFPWLRRLPARVLGLGFRAEHVRVRARNLRRA